MKATKLPSGHFRTQVVAGYDENGKRVVRSFTAEKEWEAIRLAEEFREHRVEYMASLRKRPERITVRDAINGYIASRSNILAPSTVKGYNNIKAGRLQSIMSIDIKELTAADVQLAVNIDAPRLSRKSIKSALALLKSALDFYDVELKIRHITLPQAKVVNKEIPPIEKVLGIVIGSELELPCLLAMWLSLRMSEVRGLQFRDISEDGRFISVNRTKVDIDRHDVVREVTKTKDSARTNRLPGYIYELIQRVPHDSDTDYIVPQRYDKIRRDLKKLMSANGLNITFHKLRHEFATTLNDLGVPSDYIQSLGGWSSDHVMKKIYVHTKSSREQQYQKIIDDFFSEVIGNVSNGSNITCVTDSEA